MKALTPKTPRKKALRRKSDFVGSVAKDCSGAAHAAAGFCCFLSATKEDCGQSYGHTRRVLRGTYHGSQRVGTRLRDAWVAVHTSVRGFLERSWRPVLWKTPDGHQLSAGVRTEALPKMGHCRPLAYLGSARRRKERLPGARMVSLAQHRPHVRVTLTTEREQC